MNKPIKAIQTNYKGYKFRSRLEARWAVFFDSLGIEWEYEIEGFELSNGQRYLPDFYLPNFNGGLFVEVKPNNRYDSKAETFAKDLKQPILMAVGCPEIKAYKVFTGDDIQEMDCCFNSKYIDKICRPNEMRLYSVCDNQEAIASIDAFVIKAINHAKSARFEHRG